MNWKTNREEEASKFTCYLCFEENLPTSTKKFKNGNRCAHSFCTDCMEKYIKVQLRGKIVNIRCPSLFCRQMLDHMSCRCVISAQVYQMWCEVLCELALYELDTCYCPYPDCSAMVLNECGGDVTKSECPNCKRLFCFRCKQPWHAGYGCGDPRSEIGSVNDSEFRELEIKKEWTRCPRCKHCVELAEGCFIVYCRCGCSFCYKCGRKTSHKHWCKGYRFGSNVFLGWIIGAFIISSILYFKSGDPQFFSIIFPLLSLPGCAILARHFVGRDWG